MAGTTTETISVWRGGAWVRVAVPAYATPDRRAARRTARPATPRSRAPLSDGSPFAGDTRAYTAYDPEWAGPLADMRTYLPVPAVKTHRRPTRAPSRDTQPQPRRAPRTR